MPPDRSRPAVPIPSPNGRRNCPEYCAFGGETANQRPCAVSGRYLVLSIGLFAYGVSIEGLQALTDYRSADVRDVVADMLGVLLGSLLLSLGRFLASRY